MWYGLTCLYTLPGVSSHRPLVLVQVHAYREWVDATWRHATLHNLHGLQVQSGHSCSCGVHFEECDDTEDQLCYVV